MSGPQAKQQTRKGPESLRPSAVDGAPESLQVSPLATRWGKEGKGPRTIDGHLRQAQVPRRGCHHQF
jgi:hypothetical protein